MTRAGSLVALWLASLRGGTAQLLLDWALVHFVRTFSLHLHLSQLLFDLQPILVGRNDATLGDQLTVLMVEYHSHGVLEVLELLRVDAFYLLVRDLRIFHQREENVCRQVFHLQAELLGDLTLLEALVDASNVLAQCRIVVVLDAVVAPAIEQLGDVGPLVAEDFVSVEDDLLLDVVYRRLLDARVQVIVPALTALLSCPTAYFVLTRQLLRDECPALRAIPRNQVDDGIVLRLVPELALARILAFLDVLPGGRLSTALTHLDS